MWNYFSRVSSSPTRVHTQALASATNEAGEVAGKAGAAVDAAVSSFAVEQQGQLRHLFTEAGKVWNRCLIFIGCYAYMW